MKKNQLFFLVLAIIWPVALSGQKLITLRECYEMALEKTSLAGEKENYSMISGFKDDILRNGWLPSLDAGGNFVYNSSVIDMSNILGSLPIPGIGSAIKPLPHEQYKLTLDINQVIYDGGAIKGARALEKADLSINEKQTETDLYKLRGQINTYYFNILLLSRQEELLTSYYDLITKRITSLESALENGVILKSDIDILTSEKIKIEQQLAENAIRNSSLRGLLSEITGEQIDPSSELLLPVAEVDPGSELSRPELQLFDLRKNQLSAGLQVIESKRMPRAFGFATLGYGNPPGNNFFKDEFAPFYILGAGIKWNIYDWNKTKNEKEIIAIQQNIIENRKTDLSDNLKRALEAKRAEILSLKSLLETDTGLIALRKRITAAAESQYSNGTITATEYLNEVNSENQALVNHEIHKINLSLATIEYMNIKGQEIE